MDPVVIIGGGAAGILAAIGAREMGVPVILLEQNKQLGLKLLITGKGRCNLTNTTTIDNFIQQYPDNGRFLYSALANFSNRDLLEFFEQIGVRLKEERGGRVFPLSDRSQDVVQGLKAYVEKLGVDIQLNNKALELIRENHKITGIRCTRGIQKAKSVIVATGGLSYPRTGSTGDGYEFARELGHTVTPLLPSLVPLETEERWVEDISGLALRNVRVIAKGRDKIGEKFGELLFTHFGLSGPIILTLSREIVKELKYGKVKLEINLKPALEPNQLDKRILRDFGKGPNKHLRNALTDLLPMALIEPIISISGLDATKPVHQITKKERQQLVAALQSLPLTVTKARPIREAIVTSGGISLKEIEPKTMASKVIPNLFFAGEVLDIDGFTGGYNLQAAFSTGYLAGQSAAML